MSGSTIRLLVTGDRWLKNGGMSYFLAFKELVENAKHRILVSAYSLNEPRIFDAILKKIRSGLSVDIFIHEPQNPKIVRKLSELSLEFSNLTIYSFEDITLHAKILIVDGKKSIIGSANMTLSGCFDNYEMGVLIENKELCYRIERLVRSLVS